MALKNCSILNEKLRGDADALLWAPIEIDAMPELFIEFEINEALRVIERKESSLSITGT